MEGSLTLEDVLENQERDYEICRDEICDKLRVELNIRSAVMSSSIPSHTVEPSGKRHGVERISDHRTSPVRRCLRRTSTSNRVKRSSLTCNANISRPVPNLDTSYPNRSNQTPDVPICQGWLTHSMPHNTSWRCFAARCRKALRAAV